ncbi:MAG: tRNA pseudouridine(13) synthase TruD [Polyangiaceae bacterium]|nr:tRNA pseudouridine(13) synthase TruD [Polyangiaceae bacterium]
MSTTVPSTPRVPPRRFAGTPPVAAGISPEAEDFVVEELPAFPATGTGEHWLLNVRKRELTTAALLHELAKAAGVAERDLGHAGMKDRHAVTTQWVTVPARGRPPETWVLPEAISVLSAARHESKLRTGHLAGNRFRITLVGVAADGLARARELLDAIATGGLPNYFGAQRFGREGNNLAESVAWLEAGAPARGKRTRMLRKLYPSVVQSEIFNRYLERRSTLGLDRLLQGDVVRLEGRRAVFLVEDPEVEQPRLAARQIHLTGPMVGPKMRAASGVPHELETTALAELCLGERALDSLARLVDGTRRDLLLWPEELTAEAARDHRLTVTFVLPPGGYATQVLRELVATPWLKRCAAATPTNAPGTTEPEDDELAGEASD